jgi:hypothetical protein
VQRTPIYIVEAGGGFNREGSIERVQRSRVRRLRRRQRQRYKVNVRVNVNCCVKREGLRAAYAHIYRQVSLHQTNQPTKLSKQTKQANQASSTSSTASSTGPDERTTKEPNRSKQASTSKTKRKPNENQTKTKRKPSSISAATKTKQGSIHRLEPSRLQTLTNTSRKTAQRTAIPKRGCR